MFIRAVLRGLVGVVTTSLPDAARVNNLLRKDN
jgi:hypothetical protein